MNSLPSVIFFRIFRTLVCSTVAMSFCTWIIQSSKYLQLLNNNLSLTKFFRLTSFLAMDIVAFVLPIALAISAAIVYHRMAESRQIVALQSAGIPPQEILYPLVLLASFVTGYLYLSNAVLSPIAWREFRRMEFNIKNNIEPPNSSGQIFSNDNFAVYAQKYLGGFNFGDIFVVDMRDQGKINTFFARSGSVKSNILFLKNGERVEIDASSHKSSVTKFGSYVYDLKEIVSFHEQRIHPNEKFLFDLLNVSADGEQKALFHQKVLSPLLAVIFSLLAFFFVGLAPYSRKFTYFRTATLIGTVVLTQGVFLSFANMAAKNAVFNYINYIFVGTMFALSVFIVRKKDE